MNRIRIAGYGRSLGNKQLDFKGHSRYRISEEQSHYTLAREAVHHALTQGGFSLDDMDLLVYASAVDFQPIPCSAAIISEMLKPRNPIPCMDINTSCTSFIAALDTLSYLMEARRYHRVLIVSAEVPSLGLNPRQQESFELFSDAGAAFIFERTDEDRGVVYAKQNTWSEGAHQTEIRGGLTRYPAREYRPENHADYCFDMKGKQVLFLTMEKIELFCREFQQESGYKLGEMDCIIPHQASRALGMIMKRLGIPKDNYLDLVSQYGNMVSVSIPFVLSLALEKQWVQPGHRLLLLGTAAGLSIHGLILKI